MSFEQRVVQLEETNAELVKEVVRVRDAAAGLNRIHNSVSEGRQAVGDGQYFVVPQEGAYLRLYRRDGSSAETIAEFASAEALQQAIDDAEADAEARMNAGADRAEGYADNKGFVNREMLRREATLDLDFAAGRYSVDDGEKLRASGEEILTVERASPKWVMGPNGKLREVPPDTLAREWKDGKCQGALIEESRTNLLRWSGDFTQGVWSTSGATVEQRSDVLAPDGSQDVFFLKEDNSDGVHRVRQTGLSRGVRGTFSFFVYPASRRALRVRNFISPSTGVADYFFDTLEVDSGSAIFNGEGAIHPVGGGWFRVSYTADEFATGLWIELRSESNVSYQGDGESGIYIWGAQLEEGPTPSSYIPTEDAPVTRATDNVRRVLDTEFPFDGFTVAAEISRDKDNSYIYVPVKVGPYPDSNFRGIGVQSQASSSYRVGMRTESNTSYSSANTTDDFMVWAFSVRHNIVVAACNGVASTLSEDKEFIQELKNYLQALYIGSGGRISGSSDIRGRQNGYTSSIQLIPRALSEEELIALTTPDSEE